MSFYRKHFLLFVVVAAAFFVRCEIDHGLGLMKSRIQGRVILPDMSKRPDYVESVRVIATTKNLQDLQEGELTLSDVVFTNTSIDLGTEKPAYDLSAPLGTYKLIAAVWKKRDKPWDYTRFFGFYGFDPETFKFDFSPVVLTEERPVAKNIDIYCDWSFVSP